ncbi:HK97-gp10 family putative phage morphogenesis protein [Phenylobacterium sp.]|uniref:HK97-gp10 family putative phage morphogenesis protein n=1 Tax=Phenylobacterium sp. TaxID=1871053 RepID=UPI00301BF3A0
MKTRVKIEGLSQTLANLNALPKALGRGTLRRVLTKAIEPMAETARALAPDDPRTGPPHDLKSSIQVSGEQRSSRLSVRRDRDARGRYVRVYMGPTKDGYPQAMPQEFGAEHHPPTPFMRPAWDVHAESALSQIATDSAAEVKKTADRLAQRQARAASKAKA